MNDEEQLNGIVRDGVLSPADPTQILPEGYKSPTEIREGRNKEVTWGETFKASAQENLLTLNLFNKSAHEYIFAETDYSMDWNEETLTRISEGLPDEYIGELKEARSYEHAMHISQSIKDRLANQQVLAQAGWSGVGLSILSSIFDPAMLTAGLATGGSGFVSQVIGKGAWSSRAGRSALVGASATGIEESLLTMADETRTTKDIMTAMLYGAAFGGVLGPLGTGPGKKRIKDALVETSTEAAAARAGQSQIAKALEEVGVPLSAKGQQAKAPRPSPEATPLVRQATESLEGLSRLSKAHARVAKLIEPLARNGALGVSGVRAFSRIIAQTDGRSLKGINLSLSNRPLRDSEGNQFDNAIGMSEGNLISLREGDPKSKRHLGTLLHEIGHAGLRKLPKKRQADAKRIIESLRDRNRLRPLLEDIAGKDKGRSVSRLEKSDSEAFAELFSKSLMARLGGPDLASYSKKVKKQADAYLNSKSLDPEDREAIDRLVDEIAGVDNSPARRVVDEPEAPVNAPGDVVTAAELDTLDFETPDRITGFMGLLRRLDLTGFLKTSKIDSVRRMAGLILYDSVGDYNGRPRVESLEEYIERSMNSYLGKMEASVSKSFNEWASRQPNLGTRFSDTSRADFMNRVGEVMHLDELPDNLDPNVAEVLGAQRKAMSLAVKDAVDAGVPGAKEIYALGQNYRPRLASTAKRTHAYHKYGKKAVVDWFQGAVLSRSKKLNPNDPDDVRLARQMARGYVARQEQIARERTTGVRSGVENSAEEVEELLALFDLSDADMAKARDIMQSSNDGTPSIFKERMPIDEDFVLPNPGGKEGESLRFRDLFETDGERLAVHYIQSATRATADWNLRRRLQTPEQRANPVLREDGTKAPPDSFDEHMKRARKELDSFTGAELAKENRRLKLLEIGYKQAMGQHIDDSMWSQYGRILMKANFSRIGARFGIAALGEVPAAVTANGLGVLMNSIPELRRMVRGGPKILREDDDILSELYAMGVGVEGWSRPSRVIADTAGDLDWDRSQASRLNQAERVADKAGRAVSVVSGMQGITNMSRVMFANTLAQRMANLALKDGKAISSQRLADMGMSLEDADAVFDQIRKHADVEDATFGIKMKRANVDKWEPEIAAKYARAITQASNAAVQKNHIGSLPPYAHSVALRMALQFRTFVMGATGNHLLRGIRLRDTEVFQAWAWHIFGGALSYSINQATRVPGDEKGMENYHRNMRMDRFVLGSLSRAAPVAIVPGLVDSALGMTTNYQLFSHARSSGLSQSLIQGNPTVDLFNDVSTALGAGSAIRSDTALSSRQVNAARSVLPLNNFLMIDNTLKHLEQKLPYYSQEREVSNNVSDILFGED